jgi:hypothetical protein
MMERIKYLQTESDNWEDIDIPTTLSTPVTSSEAAAAIAPTVTRVGGRTARLISLSWPPEGT